MSKYLACESGRKYKRTYKCPKCKRRTYQATTMFHDEYEVVWTCAACFHTETDRRKKYEI